MTKINPSELGYDGVSDLMLVNRGTKSYQADFNEIRSSVLNGHIIHNDTDPNNDYSDVHPDVVDGTISQSPDIKTFHPASSPPELFSNFL